MTERNTQFDDHTTHGQSDGDPLRDVADRMVAGDWQKGLEVYTELKNFIGYLALHDDPKRPADVYQAEAEALAAAYSYRIKETVNTTQAHNHLQLVG